MSARGGNFEGAAPLISVCVFTGRHGVVLGTCLDSLLAQVEPPPFELLVSADRDPRIVEQVLERFPDATVGTISGALPGAARNSLIERARGELLLFLDDDVVAGPHLLRRVLELARLHPEVGVFGGPNLTPPGSSLFQNVQGAVLGSIVAAGPARKRYGAHPAGPAHESSLTLCNLVVRRELAVPFVHDFVCAEENEAMRRLRRKGVAMRSEPDLVVYHERRGSFRQFAAQMYKYGQGRGQLLARDPRALRVAHVLPSVLILYALALPALAMWSLLFAIPGLVYLAALALSAARVAVCVGGRESVLAVPRRVLMAAILVVTVHACYGTGVVRGLFRRHSADTAPLWVPVVPHVQAMPVVQAIPAIPGDGLFNSHPG